MTSASYLRTLGCISSGPIMYVQVPQVVSNLVFPYSVRDFAPLVPILQSISWTFHPELQNFTAFLLPKNMA